jgi:hypothetical protein
MLPGNFVEFRSESPCPAPEHPTQLQEAEGRRRPTEQHYPKGALLLLASILLCGDENMQCQVRAKPEA